MSEHTVITNRPYKPVSSGVGAVAEPAVSLQPLRILLVEDDTEDARFIRLLLGRMLHLPVEVTGADRLSSASEIARHSPFDLILLDLSLPDSSGLATLSGLQEQVSTTPIIVLTGLDDEAMSVSMLQQGAQDYLIKGSVQSDTLRRAIRYALERHRISQELWRANQNIQRANEDLENRVRKRTRDLEELNQTLTQEVENRRKAEEAALLLKDQAEQASQAKSQFLSRMSHEFRTPLNAVLGFGQVLEFKPLERSQAQCVQQIMQGGRHLLQLVEEVLDLTRIEGGRLDLHREVVRLSDILQEAVSLTQPLIEQHQVHLICKESVLDEETMLYADRLRLKQVLLNLLSNAAKYNVAGGSIILNGEHREKHFRLNVADTGMGIPEEKLPLLFRPFERLGVENRGIDG